MAPVVVFQVSVGVRDRPLASLAGVARTGGFTVLKVMVLLPESAFPAVSRTLVRVKVIAVERAKLLWSICRVEASVQVADTPPGLGKRVNVKLAGLMGSEKTTSIEASMSTLEASLAGVALVMVGATPS